jgi:hypothetical protein
VSDPRPGRFCPPSYRYSPASLARASEIFADTLYIVGGLYGNSPALDVVERLAATESGVTRVIFNGDFHWFDVDPSAYVEIDRRVAMHIALRGNVETELASEDAAVGCGCAYPESVSEADVARSNDILACASRLFSADRRRADLRPLPGRPGSRSAGRGAVCRRRARLRRRL